MATKAKAAKKATPLNTPRGVERRDLLVMAAEREQFAADLMWLVKRSMECALYGPQPLPGLGLAEAGFDVHGARLRIERASARVSSKRSREHHELLALQSTMVELAGILQAWSKSFMIRAGTGKGRPRAKNEVEARAILRATLGIAPLAAAKVKARTEGASGRRLSLDITTEQLDHEVTKIVRAGSAKTSRAACGLIAQRLLAQAGRWPSAEWRQSRLLKVETARLESRLSQWRRRRSSLCGQT